MMIDDGRHPTLWRRKKFISFGASHKQTNALLLLNPHVSVSKQT